MFSDNGIDDDEESVTFSVVEVFDHLKAFEELVVEFFFGDGFAFTEDEIIGGGFEDGGDFGEDVEVWCGVAFFVFFDLSNRDADLGGDLGLCPSS